MKNVLQVAFLISILIACSDFYPEKIIEKEGGAHEKIPSLPQKAELDEKACDYGEVNEDLATQFLWNLATKSVCPRVQEFRFYATELRMAAQRACAAKSRKRAQSDMENAWRSVMANFEYLVANPMGPLFANKYKLANEIYAWPMNNKTAINAELIKASQMGEAYEMNLAPSRKGLSAVERLVFDKETRLLPGVTGRLKPEEEAFNAQAISERQRARCIVLDRLVADVAARAEMLYQDWDAGQNKYPRRMLESLRTPARQMVLNEVSDGLFYLEKVKDFKLGRPLGQNARCRSERCPEEVEHALSGAGGEALRENFEAFRAGMVGQDGPGFLSLVREVGRGELADRMQSLIERMGDSLKEVEQKGDLAAQITAMDKSLCTNGDSPVPICRLYFQWKDFSAIYRSDFMSALNLNPPKTEADND